MKCKHCDTDDWRKVHTDTYGGHKGGQNRDDTEKEVFECEGCGSEGRRFTDGVTGNVTHSGAMRE